ncbi:PREDICTED: putative receptor-like protein kinase At3g47110 [Nelumbo nucifera]|uniref:non-specific serine/threonine protein kinase n=1 Tax=Nelumbo nucifera TaxID=4432 RepID=A0A1U8PYW4_NELNU|nr:PREDICTED: putative receptor-like protein kinase At3g47110 [Nelumbo nucifera]
MKIELPSIASTLFRLSAIHVFFLLLCSEGPITTNATPLGNETDRLALFQFKNAITNDPLGALSSWNESLHFCEWQGITCGRRHQRVTVLNLQGQSLVGTVSPCIRNLTFLRSIELGDNSFHGAIPQEVGRLLRLRYINLSDANFEREIPRNLTNCYNLKVLDLSRNNLTGKVPFELDSLSKLSAVILSANYLTGKIPPSFGNLSSLQSLRLVDNSMEGSIPKDLGRLTRLSNLYVGANELSGMFPNWIYNMSSIAFINVALNRFYGRIPLDVGLTMPKLKVLGFDVNNFTGPIPVSLFNISGLERLDLGQNSFTGSVPLKIGRLQNLWSLCLAYNRFGTGQAHDLAFLTELTNCSNLEILQLQNNNFGCSLPKAIANLSTQLTILALGQNQLFGSLPSGIENLMNLTGLSMEGNLLGGSIPTAIGMLQKLKALFMGGNRFAGEIPLSLGNITSLNLLHLEVNYLTGCIPSSLGNCQKLQTLTLHHNNLNGSIPRQVIGLYSLTRILDLSYNSLSGSLPLEVGKMKNIGILDLSENNLSREIPVTIGDCSNLENLYLEGNSFNGTIPESLGLLKAIQGLDLSRNNLSGQIPKIFENLHLLSNFNLSFNSLVGEVPTKGAFANASAISVVGNYKLCGEIPELQLPSCSLASTRGGKSTISRVIIAVAVGVLCLFLLLIFLVLYWKGNSKRKSLNMPPMGDQHLMVSYKELLQATGGFSESSFLGSGSFGSVYKGNLNQGITVAVKVFNLQQPRASKSFMAECNALKNIRHRNLVRILTSCSSLDFKGNDFKALVYEFMANGSLEDWLHPDMDAHNEQRNLNILQRINIAIDVASALDYLHNHCHTPIIHCDLKPSNVLLDNDFTAHVSDFGLAKLLLEDPNYPSHSQASSFVLKGTIGYTPPEIFTGKKPTDEMFKDDLNLQKFAKMALPVEAIRIFDPILLQNQGVEEIENGGITNFGNCSMAIDRSPVLCAVTCSLGSARLAERSEKCPRERMDISEAAKELIRIRDIFHGIRVHQHQVVSRISQLEGAYIALTMPKFRDLSAPFMINRFPIF